MYQCYQKHYSEYSEPRLCYVVCKSDKTIKKSPRFSYLDSGVTITVLRKFLCQAYKKNHVTKAKLNKKIVIQIPKLQNSFAK